MGATSLLNVTGDWAASAIAQPPWKTVTKPALIIVTSRNQALRQTRIFYFGTLSNGISPRLGSIARSMRPSLPCGRFLTAKIDIVDGTVSNMGAITRRAVVWLAASGNPGATHGTGY